MSAFGGDNWAREAQQRKRRVDDLIVQGLNSSKGGDDSTTPPSFKKLSNGKYACLICPNNPILDSSLMLSMHNKGSRHIAAEYRRKERELMRQEEINKRIALSEGFVGSSNSGTANQQFKLNNKPLIEWTRKAAAEILNTQMLEEQNAKNEHRNVKLKRRGASFFAPNSSPIPKQNMEMELSQTVKSEPYSSVEKNSGWATKTTDEMLIEHQFHERRERELKFTSAGWKRDCQGRWYRDENTEFDSDEEDPNVCLT